jgi:hypothetical protein
MPGDIENNAASFLRRRPVVRDTAGAAMEGAHFWQARYPRSVIRAAALPSAAINFRRPILTGMCPSLCEDCPVRGTITRCEQAVFTFGSAGMPVLRAATAITARGQTRRVLAQRSRHSINRVAKLCGSKRSHVAHRSDLRGSPPKRQVETRLGPILHAYRRMIKETDMANVYVEARPSSVAARGAGTAARDAGDRRLNR